MSKQKHDRGNIKRKYAERLRDKADDRSKNTNSLAASLVKRGLASVHVIDIRDRRHD